jgi:predicted deacylase
VNLVSTGASRSPRPSWWGSLRPGQRHRVVLDSGGTAVEAFAVAGAAAGPVLAVLAGIHGDEYEGPVALAESLPGIAPERLRGTLLAVPVANPSAFAAGTRESPLDGENLARCFPGRTDGGPSERLAAVLTQDIIAQADALIDLHSAGVAYEMPLLAGYPDLGEQALRGKSRALATAFGAPVLWRHPQLEPGRTLSAAFARGIPCMYTEAPGGGGAPAEVVRCFREGLLRVLTALGMLDGAAPSPRHRAEWVGDGNTDAAVPSPATGLFRPGVGCGDRVDRQAPLGEVLSHAGDVLAQIRAPSAGIVAMIRRTPRVRAGQGLFLLTQPA